MLKPGMKALALPIVAAVIQRQRSFVLRLHLHVGQDHPAGFLRKIRSSDLLCAGQIVIKHSCSTSLSFSVRSGHLGVAMCVIAPQIRLDSLLMPRIRTVTREPLGGRPRLG